METVIVGGIVLIIILLAIRSVYKNMKSGGCSSCDAGRSKCSGCNSKKE